MSLRIVVAGALLGILSGSPAVAQVYEVSAFGYGSASTPGRTFEHRNVGKVTAGRESLARMRAQSPEVAELTLYCADSPGPRFMQVDGRFYTLNGKSRRDGAYVETRQGRLMVRDSIDQGSPAGEDVRLLNDLIQEAEAACR